jgi:hypothetical protein
MNKWPWQKWVGKLWPWALAAVGALLEGVLELNITWWPTAVGVATGIVQFILSMFPVKE